jgi:SOS response regulatory protein OraA/RecX
LRGKGIDSELIDAALAGMDETDAARRAAEKHARRLIGLPEEEFRRKLGGHLQRRGFQYETIKLVLDETWQSVSVAFDDNTGPSDT